jgi:putative ABC transport system permease protein
MSIRTTKVLRDVWVNKARSLLIVLAVTVGVTAFGLMLSGARVLEQNLKAGYATTNPAHTALTLAAIDDALVAKVQNLPYVQAAQAGQLTRVRLETTPGQWLSLDLATVADFQTLALNRLTPVIDAPAGSILLEESVPSPARLGDDIKLQLLDGAEHTLRVAGYVNDLSRLPAGISLIGAGYVSEATARTLGLPLAHNRLYVRFKGELSRADVERQVTALTTYLAAQGHVVLSAPVPPPDEYVLGVNMTSVLFILQALGLLTLVLSALLVTSVMSAVITQQIPQIGILKSLGARWPQLTAMYFQQVLAFGLVALVLSVALGQLGAYFLAQGIASTLNFHVTHFFLPWQTVLLQAGSALFVPLVAAAFPIFKGARLTIRAAIGGYNPSGAAHIGPLGRLLQGLPQLANIAVRNAFRRPGRLALTFAALTLSGAMFIAILGIRQSLHLAVVDIQGDYNYDVGVTFAQPYPVSQIRAEAAAVGGVRAVEAWALADGRLVLGADRLSGSIVLQGVPGDTQMAAPGVVTGRWLTPQDTDALFVNSDFIALAPELRVGSTVTLRVGGVERAWTIVGVSARSVAPMAYAHYDEVAALAGWPDLANGLVLATVSSAPAEQARVQADLARRLDQAGVQVTSVDTTAAKKDSSAAQLDSMVILLMSIVVLVALVGGLGLAITLSLNVLERTREIGILRSLGAQNGVVRRVVTIEALVIALVSWLAAIPLSIPLAVFLGNALGMSLLARPLDYVFSVPAVLLWLALVIVIAVLASALPAQNAARLTIREAIAYE